MEKPKDFAITHLTNLNYNLKDVYSLISSLVLCDETYIPGIIRNPIVKAFYDVGINSYYVSLSYLIDHINEFTEILIEGYYVAGMYSTLTTYTKEPTQMNLLVSKQRYEPEDIEA